MVHCEANMIPALNYSEYDFMVMLSDDVHVQLSFKEIAVKS